MKKTFAAVLPLFALLAHLLSPALPLVAMSMAASGQSANLGIYYMIFEENKGWQWRSEEIALREGLSGDETAYSALSLLLEKAACVPEGAEVTGVAVANGLLLLNMSEATFNGGGSEAERIFAAQLLRTALSLPGVERVTLMRDNRPAPLAEGTLVVGESEWEGYFQTE